MRVNRTVQLMPWDGWSIHILRYEVHSCGRTPHGVRGLKLCRRWSKTVRPSSHPSRGAWIEIRKRTCIGVRRCRSHPSRGAWIEIARMRLSTLLVMSHPSRGAWIEILYHRLDFAHWYRRTPHGVRGLKSGADVHVYDQYASHPSRGAWIEIRCFVCRSVIPCVAPLTGCVD